MGSVSLPTDNACSGCPDRTGINRSTAASCLPITVTGYSRGNHTPISVEIYNVWFIPPGKIFVKGLSGGFSAILLVVNLK
jgi:hypothetical protein